MEIFRILQNFAAKLDNFTNFTVLFPNISFFRQDKKICLKHNFNNFRLLFPDISFFRQDNKFV